MRKNYYLSLVLAMVFCISNAQITETFESSTVGTSSFTNSVFVSTLVPSSSFKVGTLAGNFGYLSSTKWIENTSANPASIKSTSTFKVGSLYLYPSSDNGSTNQTASVSVTFTGKLAGATLFTYTPPSSDFAAASWSNTTNRGFSLVNFSTPGHQNTVIDELVIDINGTGNYFAIDNYRFTSTVLNNENFDINSNISVFPNPSASIFQLDLNFSGKLELFDNTGKYFFSKSFDNGISNLDLTNFTSGIYFLRVTNTENKVKTIKLVKN